MTRIKNQARLCNLLLLRRRIEDEQAVSPQKSFQLTKKSPVPLFSMKKSYQPIENKSVQLPMIKLSNMSRSRFDNGLARIDLMKDRFKP